MKFQELKKNLEADGLKNIYYILGSDAYLRQKATNMIIDRAVTMRDLNVSTFTDENTDISNVVDACRSMAMMDKYRVVVLNDLVIKERKKSKDKKEEEGETADEESGGQDIQALTDYCKNPLSTTILIIIDSKNNATIKKLQKYAETIDCSPMDAIVLTKLVLNELKKYNCTINSDALSKLIEYCANDYTRINNEIIKLGNLLTGGQVTLQDVEANVPREVEYVVFELTNALSNKDGKKAIEVVENLLTQKEPPQKLFMMIIANFRRMFFATVSKESNLDIANKLGVKEYSIKVAKEMGAKFTPAKLKKILDMGAELDYKIKFGQISDKIALYYYISNIVSM